MSPFAWQPKTIIVWFHSNPTVMDHKEKSINRAHCIKLYCAHHLSSVCRKHNQGRIINFSLLNYTENAEGIQQNCSNKVIHVAFISLNKFILLCIHKDVRL